MSSPSPMMTKTKRIHLIQHVKHVKHGDTRVRTRDLELSLDEDEVNYYICRHNGTIESKEDFELLSEGGQDMDTLAILHTQVGFVCLEARISDVYVPLLGLGFDGQSAHDFRVRVSRSDETRSFLQLRPGEPFYVRDLSLSLVPEEQNDQYTQLVSSGIVPSYERYSQNVSQLGVESQSPCLPSPAKMKRPYATILGKPRSSTPGSSPLATVVTPRKPQSHAVDIGHSVLTEALTPNVDHNVRKRRKVAPILAPMPADGRQSHAFDTPEKPETLDLKSETLVPMEATVPSVHAEIKTKTRKSPPVPEPIPADESQDSLAGKIIEVAGRTNSPNPKHTTSSIDQAASFSSSSGTKSNPNTPSINTSIQESAANSFEPPSSMRSRRSAMREDFHHLNMQDDGLCVLFSSATTVGESRICKRFLTEHGVKIVQDIKEATCLCVGNGELKRTTKLILAVLKGIQIIRETWVTDSAKSKQLQDVGLYKVEDSQAEQEWGMKLEEAIERGRQGVRIFQGWTILITPSAKKGLGKTNFSDLKEIAIHAGAKSVTFTMPKKSPSPPPSTLIVGTSKDLTLPESQNWRYHTKDIISLSVLRGKLDEKSDEFLIQNEPNANKKRKR